MLLAVLYLLSGWVLAAGGCPERCVCQDKYSQQFADCAYKEFAAVPAGLPPNVTTLSLSANRIGSLLRSSFAGLAQVASLWLAHNGLSRVEEGALAPLRPLKNLDLSHNRLSTFPWGDLANLSSLQLLKMNHNLLSNLPQTAFSGLRDLRSLRINNNQFHTLQEGVFQPLSSLSHLQIYSNPFSCGCRLLWLKSWILDALISIPESQSIQCWDPPELKDSPVVDLPELQCSSPSVTLSSQPGTGPSSVFPAGTSLALHCTATGKPPPSLRWTLRPFGQSQELSPGDGKGEGGGEVSVLKNGTLLLPRLHKSQEGRYSCVATNSAGSNQSSLEIRVSRPTPKQVPGLRVEPGNSVLKPERASLPASSTSTLSPGGTTAPPTLSGQNCSPHPGTHFTSNHAFNRSSSMKEHIFDFGLIALEVTETDARVQLTPFQSSPGPSKLRMLYLCTEEKGRAAAVVQWSMIESGVNSYRFQGLRPGTNYSMCLTSRGQECQVQVVFSTRRKIPSLLIMVVVSCFLLALATVPLLGASCCHLLYKYQGKTYKLIMKSQGPGELQGGDATGAIQASVSFPGSEKLYPASEEDASEVPESLAGSQSKANTQEEFEAGSEYSDRLPLGAEAVTISPEINGNYRRPVR
ncbi:immunoglobulin superfamily containing leucine-rich repeat protein 2 [Rhincodon typus]|uniref:immunoglobulin superfamily containing leucine-rich repeat protein 2 n=1 Tax=Rhincodon typus TaxID=259920 RepID=UPI0009A2FD94|nr:immunoglobulin superfamily containing leucine-rich repeat protein 2 [Rhincodon typus]